MKKAGLAHQLESACDSRRQIAEPPTSRNHPYFYAIRTDFTGENLRLRKRKRSRRRGKYYDKRCASAQYGEVTQNTEIIQTAYGLHNSLVGGTEIGLANFGVSTSYIQLHL